MSLEYQLSLRNRILEQIAEKQNIIAGIPDKNITSKIDNANKQRSQLISKYNELITNSIYENNPVILNNIYSDLVQVCNDLAKNEETIKQLNSELDAKSRENLSKLPSEHQAELDKLLQDLSKVNEEIAKERELERQKQAKNNKFKGIDKNKDSAEYQKVVVDEDFGVYIYYPKKAVISETIKCIFGAGLSSIPENFPLSEDEILNNISNIKMPGLPTLLSVFIDLLLKTISQGFVKQFFFLKNTVDMVVGMEIGEIIGTMIPGLTNILKDLNLLLTNPSQWMFSKVLDPLFDINIPIPEFKFDLGAFIPLLPFSLKIPKIDPYGFFDKLTPFNLNADPSKIPLNWYEKMKEEIDKIENETEVNFKNIQLEKIKELEEKRQKVLDDLNGVNKYENLIRKSEIKIKLLTIKHNNLKEQIKNNINSVNPNYFIEKEKELSSICEEINNEIKNLDNLKELFINEQKRLESLNREELEDKLIEYNNDIAELKDEEKPIVTFKDFSKRAMILSVEKKLTQDGLNNKLSVLWDIGVNIFDNQVTEFLQKIGYDLTNDKQVYKIKMLRDKLGLKFNDATHLFKLYQLGFNINDPEHLKKLRFLYNNNIDIKNQDLMILLQEIGFNLNNKDVFDIITVLKNELGIDLGNIEILKKLNTIGFNFNNPNLLERFKILRKYVDIKTPAGYDNAIKKNVNLNNPYLEPLLKKYFSLNLNWNNDNFLATEAEILSTVTIEQIDRVKQILGFYEDVDSELNMFFNKTSLNNNEFIKYIYTFDIDKTLSHMNAGNTAGLLISGNFEYKEDVNPNKTQWYEEIIVKNKIPGAYTTLENHGTYQVPIIEEGKPFKIKIYHDNGFIYKVNTNYSSNLVSSITYIEYSGLTDTGEVETGLTSAVTWETVTSISYTYDKLYCIPLSSTPILNIVNRWSKYNVRLKGYNKISLITNTGKNQSQNDDITPVVLPYQGNEKFSGSNKNVEVVSILGDKKEIYVMLDLLREFVLNKGWVIDGIRIADTFSTSLNDYERMISINPNLVLTTGLTPNSNEITYEQLSGIYGNFDKLGLNIRDKEYDYKFKKMIDVLNIKLDEVNIINTKRKVTLTYYDKNDSNDAYDVKKVIDLSVSKPNPKVFDDAKYQARIEITNVIDPNQPKPPTKTVIQFDSLNKMGFNFQNPTYHILLNKLNSLFFNISAFQTVDIVDSLCALGWHYNATDSMSKLDALVKFGFNFNNDKNMNDKLNALNNIGFNFNKPQWQMMINELRSLGLNMDDKDFENAISELISFGIDFREENWNVKIQKLKELGIDFSSVVDFSNNYIQSGTKKWISQMSNLRSLGIDFRSENWIDNFNKSFNFRKLGLDYLNVENRQKIAILNRLGVDFEKPEDDYMQKIEALIQLKLIHIPQDVENEKIKYLKDREEKLTQILNRLSYLEDIIQGKALIEINEKIKKLKKLQTTTVKEIQTLKTSNVSNLTAVELNELSNLLDKKCSLVAELNNKIEELVNEKNKIIKLNKEEIEAEIKLLNEEKSKLDNKVYLLNKDITLAELEKFEALEKLGINFYEPKWIQNINKLLENNFNFSLSDWKTQINKLSGLIVKNPILAWISGIINTIITIISMPMKFIFELIKKLIGLITKIISIPLNPTKIPEWIIGNPSSSNESDWGIITRFNKLIELIKKLPSLEGMKEFLFTNPDGLMLIDIFVKGFSEFMSLLKQLSSKFSNQIKDLKKEINELKEKLNNVNKAKNKKQNELNNQLIITNSILNNDFSEFEKLIKKLKNLQKVHAKNIDIIQNNIKNNSLSEDVILVLENQLKEHCSIINDLENQIQENNRKLNELKNKPISELESEKDKLEKQLQNINNVYDINSINSEINNRKAKISELNEKISLFNNFCSLKNNINKVIEILNDFLKSMDKTNPYDKLVEEKEKQIDNLKEKLKKLQENIDKNQKGESNANVVNVLNNQIEQNNLQINQLENELCLNKDSMSDIDFYNKLSKSEELKKLNEDLKNNLDNIKITTGTHDELLKAKIELEKELDKLIKELNMLKLKQQNFQQLNAEKEYNFKNVVKWLPTIINIICCVPKFIVNICVGLFNAVGYMRNLPSLWEFDFIQ